MICKAIGIQRTGTNYITELMRFNTFCEPISNSFGWKHGEYDKVRDDIMYIVMIKNPYMWYSSIINWMTACNNIIPPLKELYDRYNKLYKKHMFLLNNYDNVYLVRYEDLIENEEKIMNNLCSYFGLELRLPIKKPNIVPQSIGFNNEKRQYYIKQIPRYNNTSINEITKILDWEVINYYGYTKIDTIKEAHYAKKQTRQSVF